MSMRQLCSTGWTGLFAGLGLLFGAALNAASDRNDVLMVTGVPWIDQGSLSGTYARGVHALDRMRSLKYFLGEDVRVQECFWNYCGSNQLENAVCSLDKYRAVVFWDVPPSVVPKDFASALDAFVKKGGVFVMAGGLTCFSGYEKPLGEIADNFPSSPYGSYYGTDIAGLLPVELYSPREVEDGIKTDAFKKLAVGSEPMTGSTLFLGTNIVAREVGHPAVFGVPWTERGMFAYHKVKPREGAMVLLQTDAGDPILAWRSVGKGKTVACMLSDRGALFSGAPVIWAHDQTFWHALFAWLLGKEVPAPARVERSAPTDKKAGVEVSLSLNRQAYDRGEVIPAQATITKDSNALRLVLLDESGAAVWKSMTLEGKNGVVPQKPYGFNVPTYDLRPGDYTLRAESLGGTQTVTGATSQPIYVRQWIYPFMKYGVWTYLVAEKAWDVIFEQFRDLGFNFNLLHWFSSRSCDMAYRYGMQSMVHAQFGGVGGSPRITKDTDMCQIGYGNGKYFNIAWAPAFGLDGCPRNPKVLSMSKGIVAATLASRSNYAGLHHAIIDEEWNMTTANPYLNEQFGLGCYCPYCRREYKQRTGKDAPLPAYQKFGYVAPADDPWYQWTRIVRREAFDRYHRELVALKDRLAPDFKLMSVDVGDDAEFEVLLRESYLTNYARSAIQAAMITDWCYAIQHGFKNQKPVWLLYGLFRMPESASVSAENLGLQVRIAIGTGVSGHALWRDNYLLYSWPHSRTSRSIEDESRILGRMIERYGPTFLNLQRVRAPVAILHSETTLDYQQVAEPPGVEKNMERPWRYLQAHELAYPAVRRAGLMAELITDNQVRAGVLTNYEAVVLVNMEYSAQDIVAPIEAFAAAGGKVFKDQSSKVAVRGSTELATDFLMWHKAIAAGKRPQKRPIDAEYNNFWSGWDLREKLTDDAVKVLKNQVVLPKAAGGVRVNNDRAMAARLRNGGTSYYFVYNINEDPNRPLNLDIEIDAQGHVYDLLGKGLLGKADGIFRASETIASADWRIYVVTERPVRGVTIAAPAILSRTEMLPVVVRVIDAEGKSINGSFPLEVSVFDPKGIVKPYSGFAATDRGECRVEIPLAANDPAGKWRIQARELMTGTESTANFVIDP